MQREIELIVIDLDGTLLRPDHTVSRRNVEAIDAARGAGIEIIIATGRALPESFAPLEAIEHVGAVITAGGAMVQCGATHETLDRRIIDPDIVGQAVEALHDDGHRVLILKDRAVAGFDYLLVGDHPLDPASTWWFRTLPVSTREVAAVHHDPSPGDSVRVGVVASEGELGSLAEQLRASLNGSVDLQHWAAVTQDGSTSTHLLEIFTRGVNKWTTVERYCHKHGIDPGGVAGIGDGLNDVELIREAAIGIAMGNADERVTRVADRVTAGNTADGVAVAIEHILDGAWTVP